MIKKFCDRCGEVINTNTNTNGNAVIPIFKISRLSGIPARWEDIDLCPECSHMFASWLKNDMGMYTPMKKKDHVDIDDLKNKVADVPEDFWREM